MNRSTQDKWAEWLLRTRFPGDAAHREEILDHLTSVRDRVLDNAQLSKSDVLLDVGAGDGLIAFGALDRLERGKVILSDISQDLIDHSRSQADEMGVIDRCEFLCASADDLSEIQDESIDVVTTRSVLIYLPAEQKRKALTEFYRVLRPAGRLSIFEPINRFSDQGTMLRGDGQSKTFWGYDVTPVAELADKIRAKRESSGDPDPLLDFDERDLLHWTEDAGFNEIHAAYEVEIVPEPWVRDWETFLNTAGNPLDPTIEGKIRDALDPDEAETFLAHLRPLVESGQGTQRWAYTYVWATKH